MQHGRPLRPAARDQQAPPSQRVAPSRLKRLQAVLVRPIRRPEIIDANEVTLVGSPAPVEAGPPPGIAAGNVGMSDELAVTRPRQNEFSGLFVEVAFMGLLPGWTNRRSQGLPFRIENTKTLLPEI